MSPDDDLSIGQKVETPYGEGVIQTTSRDKVTVFIRGRGSIKFDRAELADGSGAAEPPAGKQKSRRGKGESSTEPVEPEREEQQSQTSTRTDQPARQTDEASRDRPSERAETRGPETETEAGEPSEKDGIPEDPFADKSETEAEARGSAARDDGEARRPQPATELPEPELERLTDGRTEFDVPEQTRRRAAIEALRLGTVPPFAVRDTTISRERHVNKIQGALSGARDENEGRVVVLTGPNGSGKTHLLSLTEQEALDAGFLVGRSELEGSRKLTPKNVYRDAIRSLAWRSKGTRRTGNLQDFLDSHQDRVRDLDLDHLSDSKVLYHLLERIRSGAQVKPKVWDYVHGDERYANDLDHTEFKTTWLAFWKTAGQTLGNVMNALAYLARALGYAGLVLIVDETELILNQHVDYAIQGREWIRGLILSAKGGAFKGANGTRFEEWDTSKYQDWNEFPGYNIQKTRNEWKLRYGGVSPERDPKDSAMGFPYAPCGQVPFVLALGYTNQTEEEATVFDEGRGYEGSWLPERTTRRGILEMERPADEDVLELVETIKDLYVRAYPKSRSRIENVLPKLETSLVTLIQARLRTGAASSIRWATQTIVETLDRAAAGIPPDKLRSYLDA